MNDIAVYMFLTTLTLFLCYLHGEYVKTRARREKYNNSVQRQRETVYNAENELFYISRLETLYNMLSESYIIEQRAQTVLDNIRDAAREAGAEVFSVKTEEKAQRALYQAQRRRISIENQIRATRKAMTAGR